MKKLCCVLIGITFPIFADYYTINPLKEEEWLPNTYVEFMREDLYVPNSGLFFIYNKFRIDFRLSLDPTDDKESHPVDCAEFYHSERKSRIYCDDGLKMKFRDEYFSGSIVKRIGKINENDEIFLTYQRKNKPPWVAHYRRIPKEQVNKIFDKYGVNLNVAWQYLLKQKILQKEFRKIGGLAQFGLYRAKKNGVKMFKEPNAESDAIETFDPIMKKALVVKTGEPKNGFILVVCEAGEEGYISLSELAQVK